MTEWTMPAPRHKPSALLRAAAQAVHCGDARTVCESLSAQLPRDANGDDDFFRAKAWLKAFLPPEGFEVSWGWWREREPRVLAALMAADFAESEGD